MKWKAFLSNVFVFIIFGYLFYQLYLSWGELINYDFTLNYLYLIISILFFIFYYALTIFGFYIQIYLVGGKVPIKNTIKAYSISQLGHYIPGKVWIVFGRLYLLKKFKITKLQIIMCSLLELSIMSLASIMIFFMSLLFWSFDLGYWTYLIILIIPLALISLHPRLLNFGINIIEKIRKKEQIKIRCKYSQLIWTVVYYLFFWIFQGFAAFFLINAIYSLEFTKIPFITGVLAISWFLGFVSFFAPSGLGVREGLIVYFLNFIMPLPIAIIVAIILRLIITSIEGLYALVSFKYL